MSELSIKVELALVTYLESLNVNTLPTFPSGFDFGSIHAGEADLDKIGQTVFCVAEDSETEYPQYTANFMIPVRVFVRTPATIETDAEVDVDAAANRDAKAMDLHHQISEVMRLAFMQDDITFRLTESGNDFTCFGVINRAPIREQVEGFWMAGLSMKIYCCGQTFESS